MKCKDCFLNDRPTWKKCLNMSHAYRVAIKQDPDKLCRAMRAVMKLAKLAAKAEAFRGRGAGNIEALARWATR